MAIKERLDPDDLALAEVLEDPIFCVEFLRSTRDGVTNRELWPRKPFTYRWYQRDLLTDSSSYISLTGGRAIGKCQPETARVYTIDGYRTIRDLRKEPYFIAYALNDNGEYVQARAILQPDLHTMVYKVTLENGYTISATDAHPFLTPQGYRKLGDIHEQDLVAVATMLPAESQRKALRWHELRLVGYTILNDHWRLQVPLYPKTKHIKRELEKIAEMCNLHYLESREFVLLERKNMQVRNPISQLYRDLKMPSHLRNVGTDPTVQRHIPKAIMSECNENLKVFLEALFAQFAQISKKSITIDTREPRFARNLQEILLRFGIESTISGNIVALYDARAIYRFFNAFTLPGISVTDNALPPASHDPSPLYRYERVKSIEETYLMQTYAIYVHDWHNYISDHCIVHNSLVLEDKIIYQTLNQDILFPETKESLLATANQAQLEPVQGRLITRFTASPILKEFLQNRINRSLGVFDFRFNDVQYLLRTRIAGTSNVNNLVGLHVPRIAIDEGQLFTRAAYTQLLPTLNTWEEKTQIFICGVPNGFTNSTLYLADVKLARYKRYSVAAHNNPYYSQEDDLDNIKRYGGVESDDYQQMVLGKHGQAAFSVITRDQITQESYDFTIYRYTGAEAIRGIPYGDVLERPKLEGYTALVVGMDTGYVDPTIICIAGRTPQGQWKHLIRYELRRIDYPKQEEILTWLDDMYHFDKIGLDIGAGGTNILHSLLYRPEYSARKYADRVIPVQFGERVAVGYGSDGKELTQTTKTLGATLLVQLLQQKTLVLSEVDQECVSEMERITKLRSINGDDRYYILNEKGSGASPNDHIFAAFICFAIATRDMSFLKKKHKRLGRSAGKY